MLSRPLLLIFFGTMLVSAANAAQLDPCAAIVNNAVTVSLGGRSIHNGFFTNATAMEATFTPNFGFSLSEAAAACGFSGFNWVQLITSIPDPSPYYTADGTHLTNGSTPFTDPAPGGYAYCPQRFGRPCDWAPYYFDPNTTGLSGSLDKQETSTTLTFSDVPADACLSGGEFAGTAVCSYSSAPRGSSLQFQTELVGIFPEGSIYGGGTFISLATWDWQDTFNGTSGGISTTLNLQGADPDSGTGGITITSTNNVVVNSAAIPEPSPLACACVACLFFAGLRSIRIRKSKQCHRLRNPSIYNNRISQWLIRRGCRKHWCSSII